MAGLTQANQINDLVKQGYKVLGPMSAACGCGTLVLDPHGNKFVVYADGMVKPVPQETAPFFGIRDW